MTLQGTEHDNPRQRIQSLVREASAAEASGDGQAALALLRQAQALAPQHQGLVPAMVRLLLARGDHQEAFALAEALLAADPASVPGLSALASCQRHCRQWPQAIATYERAAALDPRNPGVQAALATLSRRPVAGGDHIEAAVAALIEKAEQTYADQDPSKALAHFRQALALHPGNPDLLAASARCRRQLGQVDQAEALLHQCLADHPNQFSVLLGLAELAADRGHWWVAGDWYARARAVDPDAPGLEERLGHCRGAAAALPRRLLLVLGMHRGGSSATAGLLCGHGFQAPPPAHTVPADAFNPRGYWEPSPIVAAHATLLEEEGLGWDAPFLPTDAWEARLLPRHGEAIGEALRLAFDNKGFAEEILLIKDPRQCRLQPIWNRVLEQHGLEAAVVLQQRHPLAVAHSLLRREQIPVNRSLLLWLQHSLAAERHTRHLPRLIVDYQQVLADPEAVLARCRALWPQHPFKDPGASADSGLIPAIDPTLNHAGADPATDLADLGPYDPQLLELALAVHGTLLGPEECRSDQLDQAWGRLEHHVQGLDWGDDDRRQAEPQARGAVWSLTGSEVSAQEPQPAAATAANTFSLEDAIAAAERAYAEGDFRLALDGFEQALGTSPGSPDLEAAIARCHRERGETQQAEQLLGGILERHPHHFATLLGLAELQVQGGDHAAAAQWYRRAVEQQPDNVDLLNTLAWCLLSAGQVEVAVEPLERALRLDPHNGQLLNAWIELCRSREELPQALEASSRLLALETASAWDRLRHVDLLRQFQRPNDALAYLDHFDAGDDQKLQAHGLQARGVLLRQLGQQQDSLTALRAAVSLDPTCPDHAVALASLLAEIGAFQVGLEGLQESERLIGSEQGLASQPWLQFAKVMLFRGAGDSEAALAIATGLAEDPQVGFSARVQRAELLMQLGDPRAEAATLGLAPLGAAEQRQALLSRSQWLKCGYRFDEAIAALEPLLASEPLDLLAADMACLLLILVMELDAAQELFFRIRAAKQASGIDHLVETAYHGLHRCLLEEFHTNRLATDQLRSLWRLPANERLEPVARMLNQEGDCTATAISLLIFARQAGRLEAWSEPSSGASAVAAAVIPAQIVQYWDASAIPDGVRSLMQSWPLANPSLRHRVFDRAQAAAFLERHGPPLARQAFQAALSPVLQSDLFRLAVLLAEGGIYADANDRCRYALAPLLGDGVSLVLQQEDIGSIGNNFIAAAPGHPLVAMALTMAATNVLEQQASNPWFLSGPGVLSLCFCRLYGTALSEAGAVPPPGVRLVSQHQLSRRISMHLQTPVNVRDGSWCTPQGAAAAGQQQLIQRQRQSRSTLEPYDHPRDNNEPAALKTDELNRENLEKFRASIRL